MNKVITFGEVMMRLATERHLRFSQARSFHAMYGGGEFNVAISLSNYGIKSEFVTKLPDNDLGNCVIMELNKRKVGTNHIIYGGERLGLYFLETGAGTRGSKVVYDRAHSSMATIKKGEINWREVFKDANWFHWSGITPAISRDSADICLEAIKLASEMGLTISCDLNYRSKLWKYGKEPKDIMPELLKYSHVILGDLDTAFFMLGKEKTNPNYEITDSLPKLYNQLYDYCPHLQTVATTLRYSVSASHQKIGGLLFHNNTLYTADLREVTPVVDRVGSGDAFMGALIYGLLKEGKNLQKALDIATAACCLKHTITGDYNLITLEEIETFIAGNTSGKVSR
ncbi:MAG: 2-dehydro-3-deoxygluconokinase [Flavobacteriaceae bacterium]|nr:2-dehydro-3-deoxygluconokinase [Flavobacteriaceae bacterium]